MNNKEIIHKLINEEYIDELDVLKRYDYPTLLNIDYLLLSDKINELNTFLKEHDKMFKLDSSFLVLLEEVEEEINKGRSVRNKVNIRLFNIPETDKLHNLDTVNNGDFVSVVAMVKTISGIDATLKTAVFECRGCMRLHTMEINNNAGNLVVPTYCVECGGKSFTIVDDECEYNNQQWLKLEEPLDMRVDGSTREIKAYMSDYLASPYHNVKPGDVVNVYGEFTIVKKDKSNDYSFLINIHNIHTVDNEYDDLNITDKEKEEIIKFSKYPDVFNRFVSNVAPNVYCHDEIKEGLVLQLFEGSCNPNSNGLEREQIHILLIGDPGLGKSQILQGVSRKAPKCINISGTGTSETGLTSTAVRDELTGSWSLEAGAVVLANGGLLTIDEYDKTSPKIQKSLNEPMEQLIVSSSKAGLVQTMTARTSILSAANPKFGKFDKFKTLREQMNIPESNLSRYDLVFALEDKIDEDNDRDMALNILNNNFGDGLEMDTGFFKKYIAYAKANIRPVLTSGAKEIIAEFYVSTRQSALESDEGKPITLRDLKAIERLTVAFAKVELNSHASYRHAEEAIRVYNNSLRSIGLEPETAGEMSGIKSNEENDFIKFAEELINEEKDLYGDNLGVNSVNDVKSALGMKLLGSRYDVEEIFSIAYSNIYDEK
ncbi:ATP-binding protein [Methanobrevibacter sp. DSM 116169]|uniref:ATP-binding protein n=1 Tax=Methanobrevibacter sp. DSM 116169 TaxID=3242727 RepID=UPI0038FCBC9D